MTRYLLLVLISSALLFSCKEKSAENKLIGTWTFEKPLENNRSIIFEKDNKCYALSVDAMDIDTLMKGTYFFTDSKKLVMNEKGRNSRTDTLNIIELSDHALKIFYKADTFILKKK